jgi:hypothetical protein
VQRLGASEAVVWFTATAVGLWVWREANVGMVGVAAVLVCWQWAALCTAVIHGVEPMIVVVDSPKREHGLVSRTLDVLGLRLPA